MDFGLGMMDFGLGIINNGEGWKGEKVRKVRNVELWIMDDGIAKITNGRDCFGSISKVVYSQWLTNPPSSPFVKVGEWHTLDEIASV